ncbi:MBL fold metallo-hydrolase [Rheinheimera sp. F8]|uniref:MBL fold metallo-hydrolase n=2 Tax=Rheinheimera sp. F8 TaxID=1763998 RepID=UPI0007449926|nr:MBL fold metallo-hydrolase [Rheinheimera sp. F8]ALZ76384.1 Zn-dependent hydrolase [Rheinheimera sp. F8]
MTISVRLFPAFALLGSALFVSSVWAADAPKVSSQQLAPQLYLVKGSGGNIAALLGKDGALVIDAQFAATAPLVKSELDRLQSGISVNTLVNTHFHKDHTDGNAALAGGARIIAHQAVLTRLQSDAKFNQAGLPTETFSGEKTLNLNGQQVLLRTMPVSHTDGDLVVWFQAQNVLHMGDLFFADRFPFIDLSSGGSVAGYIANTKTILSQVNDTTKIIPGHGDLMDKAGLQRFLAMMEQTLVEVQAMKAQGLSADQAVAKGLSAQWKKWSWNFITEEKWIQTLYQA